MKTISAIVSIVGIEPPSTLDVQAAIRFNVVVESQHVVGIAGWRMAGTAMRPRVLVARGDLFFVPIDEPHFDPVLL